MLCCQAGGRSLPDRFGANRPSSVKSKIDRLFLKKNIFLLSVFEFLQWATPIIDNFFSRATSNRTFCTYRTYRTFNVRTLDIVRSSLLQNAILSCRCVHNSQYVTTTQLHKRPRYFHSFLNFYLLHQQLLPCAISRKEADYVSGFR